jgi:hypothetical protein
MYRSVASEAPGPNDISPQSQTTDSDPFGDVKELHPLGEGTVFPGKPGRLHSLSAREIPNDAALKNLLQRDLPFEEIVDLAYMFNYHDDARLLFNRRVSVQLDESEWYCTVYGCG